MNAITTVPPPLAYGDIERLAEAIAKSNLFGIKTKEQALVLMMIARSEGRDPVEAARDYDIIQGKPAKKAEAMLRDFLVAGGKVEWHELSDMKADATFTHPQTGSVRIDWDLARANTAGFGGKDMWKKFPRQMLRSRVLSEGVRTLWPLATSGFYVPEEQADIPAEHNGKTLEHEPDAREQMNRDVPLKAAAAPMPRGARIAERAPAYEAPRPHPQMPNGPVDPNPVDASTAPEKRTWAQWKDALELAVKDARTPEERGLLLAKAEVTEIVRLAKLGPYSPAKARIIELYEEIENSYLADPPDPPEGEEEAPAIAGEDKVFAG